MLVGFAEMVASRVEGRQHRPYKTFLIVVFYINCTVFVRDVFWGGYVGRTMEGAKFGNANNKIFHAFDDKAASAQVPVFDLRRLFTRYVVDVYVADFIHFFRSRSKICRDMHNVAVFSFATKYGVCTGMYTNRSTKTTMTTEFLYLYISSKRRYHTIKRSNDRYAKSIKELSENQTFTMRSLKSFSTCSCGRSSNEFKCFHQNT